MGSMLFSDAWIFQGENGFIRGSFSVSGDRIRSIQPVSQPAENRVISLHGLRVIPGLIDIHTHGNSGFDFSDGSAEGLLAMGRYLASRGITSFAPTSMTLPYEKLEKAFRTAGDYAKNRPADGASGNLIRIVDIAPELEGAEEFIRRIAPSCRVSVAHTNASYEEAKRAFDAGASHLAHLFNAMPPIHHRNPGVIGAASEREDVAAELISDGLHVHPSIVRMAFRLFPGRICLISDALRCCGMPDGEYELGGQRVLLKDREARLSDGTLAGAVNNLYEDMVNAIRFGIRTEDAILSATMNPAKEVGADDEIGSLENGKKADFLVCDEHWNIREVYLDGIKIR